MPTENHAGQERVSSGIERCRADRLIFTGTSSQHRFHFAEALRRDNNKVFALCPGIAILEDTHIKIIPQYSLNGGWVPVHAGAIFDAFLV